MNPEVKDKWVKALRSGEYEQAQACLRVNDTFCCLGVLTDLAIKEGVLGDWKDYAFHSGLFYVEDTYSDGEEFSQDAVLPVTVMEWAGMDSNDGRHGDEQELSLAQLNDRGKSFAEIADIIEERF